MAAGTQGIFVAATNVTKSRLSTANTTRDLGTTTNAVLAFTAGANGSIVDRITFTATANDQTTASANSVLRVYVTDNSIANPRLLKEIAIAAVTPSSTAIGATGQIIFAGGLVLNAGTTNNLLYVTTSVTGGWDVVVEGGDY
jgi:hypothetical protein